MNNNNCQKNEFVIAMAYVPWQSFKNLYNNSTGLKRGTIFEELDKPFLGGGCKK